MRFQSEYDPLHRMSCTQLDAAQQLMVGGLEDEGAWEEAASDITKWLTGERDLQTAAVEGLSCRLLPTATQEQVETLGTELWLKVESFIASLCEECRHRLMDDRSEQDVTKLCQHLHRCVSALGKGVEQATVTPLYLITLTVVKEVLQLCKDVETDHPSSFMALSADLATLFKATYSSLKLSVEGLEQRCIGQHSLPTADITHVLERLMCVCHIALQFDASLLVLVWRCVGRLVSAGRPHLLSEGWSIQPLMASLCHALGAKGRESVENCPAEGSEITAHLSKLLRTCRFLATLLVKLAKEYEESVQEFVEDLFHLLLKVYSATPPSPHAKPVSEHCLSQLESNVLIVAEPLLTMLVHSESFLRLVTNDTEKQRGCVYGWAMSLSAILKFFPTLSDGLQDYLMETNSSSESSSCTCRLLDAVMTCIAKCEVEYSLPARLPGVMCSGQPQSSVTLYEHVCVHLCVLVASLPSRHLHTLEKVLLRNLLGGGGGGLPSALLAADIWCFLARWGPSDLCCRHTHLLARLAVCLCPSASLSTLPLLSLVARLLSHLTEQQQAAFVQAFPPSSPDNLILWTVTTLPSLSQSRQVCQLVASSALEVIREQLCAGTWDQHMPSALAAISSALSHPSPLPPTLLTPIVQVAMQIWDTGPHQLSTPLSELVVCGWVELLSMILVHLTPSQTLKVFSGLKQLATSPSLAISMATFLRHCRALQVPEDIQVQVLQSLVVPLLPQVQVLQGLVALFRQLLSHSHWLVRHYALEAFQAFAEVTPYADIVEQCIPPELSSTVVAFLHQVPSGTQRLGQLQLTNLLQQRVTQLQHWKQHRSHDLTPESHDQGSEEAVLSQLATLRSTWEHLAYLCPPPPLPDSIRQQLLSLARTIQDTASAGVNL